MATFTFGAGLIFSFKGKNFKVLRRISPDYIKAIELSSGDEKDFCINDLLLGLKSGEFKVIEPEGGKASKITPRVGELEYAPEKYRDIVLKREKVIKPLLNGGMTEENLAKAIEIAKRENIKHSRIAIYRWFKAYEKHGLAGLMPRYSSRGNRKQLHENIEAIINDAINTYWLSKKRLSVMELYRVVKERCELNGLRAPSYNTIKVRIKNLDQRRATLIREGKRKYESKYQPVTESLKVNYPLQCIEIDHKELDLIVVDSIYRKPIGRPWLTIAMDCFTRAVLGFHLSFDKPGYNAVMKCLRGAIWLKDEICEKYKVVNKWNMYGIPHTILVDNGPEFHSGDFKIACAQLKIFIQYRPPYTPRYGGIIERHFGIIEQKLIGSLDGKTFSKFSERGDYDPEKEACLTLDDLNELITRFIVDIYHQEYHKGINSTPQKMWDENMGVFPPMMPASYDELKLLLYRSDERTITRSGIQFENIEYWHPSFCDLIGKKVIFRFDPDNLSSIYVVNPDTKEFIEVSAKSRWEDIANLSLWEIRAINKIRRQEGLKASPENLIQIQSQFRKEIEEKSKKGKKARKLLEKSNMTERDLGTMKNSQFEPEESNFVDPRDLTIYPVEVNWDGKTEQDFDRFSKR